MAIVGKDFFHWLGSPKPHMADVNLTATKADNPIIDLRASVDRPGTVVVFLLYIRAQTLLNATNSMRFEIWEAIDFDSATALDSVTEKKSAADDILGVVQDDVLLPEETPVTGVPLINAAAMVGSVFMFQYRGKGKVIQVRPTLVLGSPDFNASIGRIHYSEEMRNLLPTVAQ